MELVNPPETNIQFIYLRKMNPVIETCFKLHKMIFGRSNVINEKDIDDSFYYKIPGRENISNIFIKDFDLNKYPLGEKIKSLTVGDYILYGVIPLESLDNMVECCIDYYKDLNNME